LLPSDTLLCDIPTVGVRTGKNFLLKRVNLPAVRRCPVGITITSSSLKYNLALHQVW
jgi:hypothetical protein